jgi:hypothetical protein
LDECGNQPEGGNMIRYIVFLFIMVGVSIPLHGAADEGTGRICALTRAFECNRTDGCKEWSLEEISLPRFIRIDLKTNTIRSLDKNVDRETRIKGKDNLEDLLVLHGTEMRGWSMAIGKTTGNLTLSASGDGDGFVVFGYCMSP